MNRENDEFEIYLDKKKVEMRNLKDSDFVTTSFNVPSPIANAIDREIDALSKRHNMDTMEVSAAVISNGLETIEKIIVNKGEEYAKNLMQTLLDASEKGDIKKVGETISQMRIDAEGNIGNVGKDEHDEDMPLEDYIKRRLDMLDTSSEIYKDEDFILINARNPEDPEDIIVCYPHRTQIEVLSIMSEELGLPVEELLFMTIMRAKEADGNASIESKQEIRKFLDRQNKRMHDDAQKELEIMMKGITIEQMKNKLRELHSFPMIKLDAMERSWRKEFKANKSPDEHKDIEIYVKTKFASML